MSSPGSGFVYRWHDRLKNMYYFGSHWGSPDDGYVCSSKWMNDAYNKRPDDFTRDIVAVVTTSRSDLLRREQYWLDCITPKQLGKGVYNLTRQIINNWIADEGKRKTVTEKIGDTLRGRTLSPEHCKKLGDASRGKKLPPKTVEQRANISKALLGYKHTAEACANMGASRRGKKFGPLSPEVREKLRTANIGKTHTPETRAKLSAAGRNQRGRTFTSAHRAAISAGNQRRKESGWTPSPKTRAKLSAAGRGRKMGPCPMERRAKIGNGLRGKPLTPENRLSKIFGHRLGAGSMQRVMNVAETIAC